jgi:O-antigen ligase
LTDGSIFIVILKKTSITPASPSRPYRVFVPNLTFDKNWLFLWSGLVIGGLIASSVAEPLALLFFGFRALKGPKETIEAFFVLAFFLLGNPNFVSGDAKTLRYLIYFLGFAAVFFRKSAPKTPFRTYLWAFLFIFLLASALGQMPVLSALKVISFFIGVYTLIEGFAHTRHLKVYWFRFVNTFFLFLVGGSIVFFLLGMGYERNNSGFQGILIHPQAFGPLMGVVTAWFTGIWLVAKKPTSFMTGLVGVSFVFIYMSQSRTAMGSMLLGGGLAYLLSLMRQQRIPNHQRLYRLAGLVFAGLIIGAILNPSRLQQTIIGFIQKDDIEESNVAAAFEDSRGFLVEASLRNFREHPIFGIGLGVPTDYQYTDVSQFKTVAGIPISASVEKGFLPTAILEEMGLTGAFMTLLMLGLLIGRVWSRHSFMSLWLLLSALLINVGEAVLFSVGGLGLFVWLIAAMTYSSDLLRPQKIRRPVKRKKQPSVAPASI